MSELAPLHSWLAWPMDKNILATINRIRGGDDVAHVAVMPDVHLARDVCVGTVMATRRLVYPAAVGGDIGCGMLAIGFDNDANLLRDPRFAGRLLRSIGERIPIHRRHRRRMKTVPDTVSATQLSHPELVGILKDVGSLQLGTLGGGNHFVELQSDEKHRLWLMIHSGSRAMGQAVRAHHLANATLRSASMMALDADTPAGQAYLHDQDWARAYASANRRAMADEVVEIMRDEFRIDSIESSLIECDHNHVQREDHSGSSLLVHRKGAMPADTDRPGVIPGSMGTLSYHVLGKGCEAALRSSAHGAGRRFSRTVARDRFTRNDLRRQMGEVWFDPRLSDALRDESPGSYKDVRQVMTVQAELVSITRTLRPVMVYKGGG
jgi:tRNA-splicing ligase RtcB